VTGRQQLATTQIRVAMETPLTELDAALAKSEKAGLVRVLRSHPELTLRNVLAYANGGGPRAAVLLDLTLRELTTPVMPDDGGPAIDTERLEQAKRAQGSHFDDLVLTVLEVASCPVRAAYLRARVGGPRWKLQRSLRRLFEAKATDRSGRSGATRYWARAAPTAGEHE
jgi:hypothetical protein